MSRDRFTNEDGSPRREYWRDEKHDAIRLSFIDAAGQPMREIGPWIAQAPVNANARTPLRLRVELIHEDGCGQVINEWPVANY
jgi:hypothetical protein